jgi:hypothetical protein
MPHQHRKEVEMFPFFKKRSTKLNPVEFIQSISKLEVKPGDTIIIKTPHRLNEKLYEAINDSIRGALGLDQKIKIVILEDGMDIGILRPPTTSDRPK